MHLAAAGGVVEDEMAIELHLVALHWASGSNEAAQLRVGLTPIATHWHQVASFDLI